MKALILTIYLFTVTLSAAAQNTASPAVRDHVKLQNEASFENRKKANVGFTVKSAKTALASEKKKIKAAKRRGRINKKRDGIYSQIQKLKTKK